MRKNTECIVLTVFSLLCLLCASCSTVPQVSSVTDGFALLSEDTDMYVYLPVQSNLDAARQLVASFVPDMSPENTDRILNRTESVWIGVRFNHAELFEDQVSFQLIAAGSFPAFFVNKAFRNDDGWTLQKGYYRHTSGIECSVPGSGLLFVAGGNMSVAGIAERYAMPLAGGSERFPAVVPEQSGQNSGDIFFMVTDPGTMLSVISRNAFSFPVEYVTGTLASSGDFYTVSVDICLQDTRSAKFAASILDVAVKSLKFLAGSARIEQKNDRYISVSEMRLPVKMIYALAHGILLRGRTYGK